MEKEDATPSVYLKHMLGISMLYYIPRKPITCIKGWSYVKKGCRVWLPKSCF